MTARTYPSFMGIQLCISVSVFNCKGFALYLLESTNFESVYNLFFRTYDGEKKLQLGVSCTPCFIFTLRKSIPGVQILGYCSKFLTINWWCSHLQSTHSFSLFHFCHAAGIVLEEKNWPPFFPIIHHDISKEIPIHLQRMQYVAFTTWLGMPILLD